MSETLSSCFKNVFSKFLSVDDLHRLSSCLQKTHEVLLPYMSEPEVGGRPMSIAKLREQTDRMISPGALGRHYQLHDTLLTMVLEIRGGGGLDPDVGRDLEPEWVEWHTEYIEWSKQTRGVVAFLSDALTDAQTRLDALEGQSASRNADSVKPSAYTKLISENDNLKQANEKLREQSRHPYMELAEGLRRIANVDFNGTTTSGVVEPEFLLLKEVAGLLEDMAPCPK